MGEGGEERTLHGGGGRRGRTSGQGEGGGERNMILLLNSLVDLLVPDGCSNSPAITSNSQPASMKKERGIIYFPLAKAKTHDLLKLQGIPGNAGCVPMTLWPPKVGVVVVV